MKPQFLLLSFTTLATSQLFIRWPIRWPIARSSSSNTDKWAEQTSTTTIIRNVTICNLASDDGLCIVPKTEPPTIASDRVDYAGVPPRRTFFEAKPPRSTTNDNETADQWLASLNLSEAVLSKLAKEGGTTTVLVPRQPAAEDRTARVRNPSATPWIIQNLSFGGRNPRHWLDRVLDWLNERFKLCGHTPNKYKNHLDEDCCIKEPLRKIKVSRKKYKCSNKSMNITSQCLELEYFERKFLQVEEATLMAIAERGPSFKTPYSSLDKYLQKLRPIVEHCENTLDDDKCKDASEWRKVLYKGYECSKNRKITRMACLDLDFTERKLEEVEEAMSAAKEKKRRDKSEL